MTINKNLVNGHKLKKSKIAANSSRFQKKSTRGKRSQQMVRSMRCINSVSELAEWREVSLKCIAKAAAIAGGDRARGREMRSDARDVHTAALEMNEEQHVVGHQPSQRENLDREEVGRR